MDPEGAEDGTNNINLIAATTVRLLTDIDIEYMSSLHACKSAGHVVRGHAGMLLRKQSLFELALIMVGDSRHGYGSMLELVCLLLRPMAEAVCAWQLPVINWFSLTKVLWHQTVSMGD